MLESLLGKWENLLSKESRRKLWEVTLEVSYLNNNPLSGLITNGRVSDVIDDARGTVCVHAINQKEAFTEAKKQVLDKYGYVFTEIKCCGAVEIAYEKIPKNQDPFPGLSEGHVNPSVNEYISGVLKSGRIPFANKKPHCMKS